MKASRKENNPGHQCGHYPCEAVYPEVELKTKFWDPGHSVMHHTTADDLGIERNNQQQSRERNSSSNVCLRITGVCRE